MSLLVRWILCILPKFPSHKLINMSGLHATPHVWTNRRPASLAGPRPILLTDDTHTSAAHAQPASFPSTIQVPGSSHQ
jgi:hypothetical protein